MEQVSLREQAATEYAVSAMDEHKLKRTWRALGLPEVTFGDDLCGHTSAKCLDMLHRHVRHNIP
eukprot:6920438-Pyramimonas_sp.AAC.1